MKELLMFSEEQLKGWQKILDPSYNFSECPASFRIPSLMLTDEQVMQFLKISKKTLYNYRKKGIISYIPILGRRYYYLPYLLKDLLELNRKHRLTLGDR